jgi:hypothetical protein
VGVAILIQNQWRIKMTALLFFCGLYALNAATYISYNKEIKQCYENITSLNISTAQDQINILKQQQSENLAILHLENYIDFFILFITEEQAAYKAKIGNKSKRLKQLDDIKLNDPNLDFIKAEILLQWALINLKFDEKLKAGSEILEAYKLLESNKKRYPYFLENNKSLSIIHVLAESLPKWVNKIVGIKGSLSLGSQEIQELADYALRHDDYFFRDEVATIHTYILYYQLNQKSKAIAELEKFKLDHSSSPLIAFLKSSMYLKHGYNDRAFQVLNELQTTKRQLPFYYLSFMKGRNLLYKQDATAKQYLLHFVDNFKGKHFIKEAYQKLAWYELSMNNNLVAYKNYMALCINNGYDLTDEDKQALKEAKSLVVPNPILLKARILFDGGYFATAQQVLIKNEYTLEKNKATAGEFNYRMGRVLQLLKNLPDAIDYFKATLQNTDKTSFFAANAALQLGLMYEEQKQMKTAHYYYQWCLNLDPIEYKNSIHQKAKSGLLRTK